MSAAKRWLIGYLTGFTAVFIAGHLIINRPAEIRQGIHIDGINVLTAFLSYVLFVALTPLFYAKILPATYWGGFIRMILGMSLAGFFIWLLFGSGDYPPEFYPYEFASAGLWFGFINTGMMAGIRFYRNFSAAPGPGRKKVN